MIVVAQRLSRVDVDEVSVLQTDVPSVRHQLVEHTRDWQEGQKLLEDESTAPNDVDLDAVRRSVPRDQLPRLWRVEEALQHVLRQLREEGVAIHGKALVPGDLGVAGQT